MSSAREKIITLDDLLIATAGGWGWGKEKIEFLLLFLFSRSALAFANVHRKKKTYVERLCRYGKVQRQLAMGYDHLKMIQLFSLETEGFFQFEVLNFGDSC